MVERGEEVVGEGGGEREGFLGVGVVGVGVVGVVGCSLRGMGCRRIGEFGLGFVVGCIRDLGPCGNAS